MTQKFAQDGTVTAVTVISVKNCHVIGMKTLARDGYIAACVACGNKKSLKKPQKGQFKDLGSFQFVREFRLDDAASPEEIKIGSVISPAIFVPGEKVHVSAKSKGRGFQGVVKRHAFHGHPKTHGHKDQLRMSGSIGAGGVQNVKKGKRMAGRMGGGIVTLKNLEVVEVDEKNSLIYIKGAIPGAKNTLVTIRTS